MNASSKIGIPFYLHSHDIGILIFERSRVGVCVSIISYLLTWVKIISRRQREVFIFKFLSSTTSVRQSLIDESELAKLFQPTSFYLTFPPYLLICRRVTTWLEINLSSWEVPPTSPSPSLTCRNMPNISRLMGAPPYESLYLPRDETGEPRNIWSVFLIPPHCNPLLCSLLTRWWIHGKIRCEQPELLALNNVGLQSSSQSWWELKHSERKKLLVMWEV